MTTDSVVCLFIYKNMIEPIYLGVTVLTSLGYGGKNSTSVYVGLIMAGQDPWE